MGKQRPSPPGRTESGHMSAPAPAKSVAFGLGRIFRSPTAYTALRLSQVGALGLGALVMAGLLRLDQYALYARGSLFSTAFAAVYLLGQDQLSYRGVLRLRTLRWRAIAIQVGVGALVGSLIVGATPEREWEVLASSCLGTAALTVTGATWVSMQSLGRDDLRALGQLSNAVTVQVAALIVAALTGSALWATNGATVTALAWAVLTLAHRGETRAKDARFIDALGVGVGGASYGLMGAAISIVVGIRGSNVSAAQDRILLLVLGAILAACTALNSEYFRNRLYSINDERERHQIRVELRRANWILGAMMTTSVMAAAFVVPAVLPAAYSGLHRTLFELAAVVPPLFVSSACFSIEIASGRSLVSNLRNVAVAVAAPLALLLVSPTPLHLLVVVLVAEWSGALIAVGSLSLLGRTPVDSVLDRGVSQ